MSVEHNTVSSIEKEDTLVGVLEKKALEELKRLNLELNPGIKIRFIPFRSVYHRFGVMFRMKRHESFEFLKELQVKGYLEIIPTKGVKLLEVTTYAEPKVKQVR